MTLEEFVVRWGKAKGAEKGESQSHFIDLCRLLGEQTPTEADPSRSFYMFEAGAKTEDGDGFADVWNRGKFAWEYKGKGKNLRDAYKQVSDYREALGNPPLLVVCDFDQYEIHTNWTNTEKWIYRFANMDILADRPVEVRTASGPAKDAPKLTALQVLKALFEDPERLKPRKTTEQITQEAAKLFGKISDELRKWKIEDMRIARFITRTLFCMFASDVGLLPRETFSKMIAYHKTSGDNKAFRRHLSQLFQTMNTGGELLYPPVKRFDGRLFADDDVPEHVTTQEILILAELDDLNWADVEPSIFGTLFERILDPAKRGVGAHYTSRADIELIVDPVLMDPLRCEWDEIKSGLEDYMYRAEVRETSSESRRKHVAAQLNGFLKRLGSIRILDPACGSGNFLYVSLALLKALEKEVLAYGAIHGVTGLRPQVHPRQLYGLEISEYAVELASVVIWIGYLQWKHRHAMPLDDEEPILQPLDQVELRDAIIQREGGELAEPSWPEADVIVGNPPFLGGGYLRSRLGNEYVDTLFKLYGGRLPNFADLCCYWFEKARSQIETGKVKRAGLLATQGIRGGANRRVLERIKETGDIFYAQADRKWIQDGVAVRVSMVGFDNGSETRKRLSQAPDDNPQGALDRALPVEGINANLTSRVDVTKARRLKENLGISFMGDTKVGPFEIPEALAQRFLAMPNPHGRPNSDLVRPWVNGLDITRRPRRMWIIDFPPGTREDEAAKYEAPFEWVKKNVKPFRAVAKSGDATGVPWWIHQRPRPEMRRALIGLRRHLGTPRLTKYRFFVWLLPEVLADAQLIVFARDDDYFFGVLHSRAHEVWALQMGTQLESRPRYTPTTCFETFPFPKPTPDQERAIAEAAAELNRLREGWLNPQTDPLGMPSGELKKRTLTSLYNERPTWLVNAHRALDEAVFSAYGWDPPISDGEILSRLLELNLAHEPA